MDAIPDELVFKITYLGGEMPNYSLNLSRASNAVLLQHYNFLRLGRPTAKGGGGRSGAERGRPPHLLTRY